MKEQIYQIHNHEICYMSLEGSLSMYVRVSDVSNKSLLKFSEVFQQHLLPSAHKEIVWNKKERMIMED